MELENVQLASRQFVDDIGRLFDYYIGREATTPEEQWTLALVFAELMEEIAASLRKKAGITKEKGDES